MPKIVAVLKGTCYNYVAGTTSVLCQSYSDSISYFVKCLMLLSVLFGVTTIYLAEVCAIFSKKKKPKMLYTICLSNAPLV